MRSDANLEVQRVTQAAYSAGADAIIPVPGPSLQRVLEVIRKTAEKKEE